QIYHLYCDNRSETRKVDETAISSNPIKPRPRSAGYPWQLLYGTHSICFGKQTPPFAFKTLFLLYEKTFFKNHPGAKPRGTLPGQGHCRCGHLPWLAERPIDHFLCQQ